MQKHVLLYWFRGGSTLLQACIRDRRFQGKERNSFFLATLPEQTVLCRDGSLYGKNQEEGFETAVYRFHMGDDTGKLTVNRVGQFSQPKIVMFVRDGRNQIASYINMKGADAADRSTSKNFSRWCEGFKNRVDCIKELRQKYQDDFLVLKMEDLEQNKYASIEEMFLFYGVKPDATHLKETIQRVEKSFAESNKHSSFTNNEEMHQRWLGWTPQQREIFNRIAGASQGYLGYELA